MSAAFALDDLIRDVAALSRDAFLERFPRPFLACLENDRGAPLPIDEQRSRVDAKARRLSRAVLKTPVETRAFVRLDSSPVIGSLWHLANKDANSGRSFVGIGTDPTCDVIFEHEALAARHGFFRFDSGEAVATFTDAGGGATTVEGRQLEPRKPHPLRNHDRLVFGGELGVIYLDPHGAYDFLVSCALAEAS